MKIREIKLETHKLPELLGFYSQTLGLSVINRSEKGFSVQVGQSVLHFSAAETASEPYYHFAFNIPENQLAEAQSWLRARVELICHEGREVVDFPNWNAHSVYFADPAGNVVELIARHSLANASEAPFGVQSLLSISEIGLPVEAVKRTAAHICKSFGAGYFRNMRSENFNALGDDEGLLLVVSQDRHWFPTEKASKAFPLRVELEGGAGFALTAAP